MPCVVRPTLALCVCVVMGFGWNDVWVNLELVLMVDVGCVWISELSHITTRVYECSAKLVVSHSDNFLILERVKWLERRGLN